MSDILRAIVALEKIATALDAVAKLKGVAALIGDIIDGDEKVDESPAPTPAAEVPMKRTRSKKAEAAPVLHPSTPAVQPVPSFDQPQPTAVPSFSSQPVLIPETAVTLDQCNTALQNAVQSGKWEASEILEYLGEFHDSRSLSKIDPVFYLEIIHHIEARA